MEIYGNSDPVLKQLSRTWGWEELGEVGLHSDLDAETSRRKGALLLCLLAIGCSEEHHVERPAPFVRTVGPFSVESLSPTVVGEAWVRIKLDPLQSELENTKVISFTYHPVDGPARSEAGRAMAVGDFGVNELPLKLDEPGEWRIRLEANWPVGRPFTDGEICLRVAEAR